MNRKQRRALGKELGKEATSSIDLMLNLGSECILCKKMYDKKDKEMAKTWFVEVFKEKKQVDLYCPECYTIKNNEA